MCRSDLYDKRRGGLIHIFNRNINLNCNYIVPLFWPNVNAYPVYPSDLYENLNRWSYVNVCIGVSLLRIR